MSEILEKKEQYKIPSIQALSLIEKASEFNWTLQITCFGLFVDSAMVLIEKKNFLNWPWQEFRWTSQISTFALLAIAFAIIMACIIPLLEFVFSQCVRTAYIYSPLFTLSMEDYKRPSGMVRPYELMELADEQQSDYLLNKVNQMEEKRKIANADAARVGSIAFKTAVLLFVNLFMLGTPSNETTSQFLLTFLQLDNRSALAILIFIGLGTLCILSWCRNYYPSIWIKYQPLYKTIKAKELERKKRDDPTY